MNRINIGKYLLLLLTFVMVSCEFELPEKLASFQCQTPQVNAFYSDDETYFNASVSNLQNITNYTVVFKHSGTVVQTFNRSSKDSESFRIPVTEYTGTYSVDFQFSNECQSQFSQNRSQSAPDKPCLADPKIGWNQDINGFVVFESRLYHGYFVDAGTLEAVTSFEVVLKNNGEVIKNFDRVFVASLDLNSRDNPATNLVYDLTNRTGEISIEATFQTACGSEIVRTNTKKIPLYIPVTEIDGGTFNIGSTEGRASDGEFPNPRITISDFAIGIYEVNVGQWNEVMGGQIADQHAEVSEGNIYRMMPVTNVSWNDCQEFISKLNSNTLMRFRPSRPYRLPTESEWEYAAGGGNGTRTRFGNGTNFLKIGEAHYNGASSFPFTTTYEFAESGGGFPSKPVYGNDATRANNLGLYNMSGNVWELCQDYYSSTYYQVISSNNPQGPTAGQERVKRGGSFGNSGFFSRVAHRTSELPSSKSVATGLRLAHD